MGTLLAGVESEIELHETVPMASDDIRKHSKDWMQVVTRPLDSSPVAPELIMAPLNAHEQFVRQAIALASQARGDGNHPFGALLVLDGQVVLTATNSVITERDPTAHAETNLVARAIRHLSPDQIGRAVLYTSCEPCAMCVGKIYWARIRSVVYALSAQELAVLAGPDFLVPCRELFLRATEAVAVIGPMLVDEARAVHVGFWTKPAA